MVQKSIKKISIWVIEEMKGYFENGKIFVSVRGVNTRMTCFFFTVCVYKQVESRRFVGSAILDPQITWTVFKLCLLVWTQIEYPSF